MQNSHDLSYIFHDNGVVTYLSFTFTVLKSNCSLIYKFAY